MVSLLRSTSIFSLMTLLSRILGFWRDMLFAHYFGASGEMGAFLVAFKIPNFMRRLFAEGAFSQAFVPIFAEYHQKEDQAILQDFARRVMGTLAVILFIVVVVCMLGSPAVVALFAPGFLDDSAKFELTSHLLRVTFPYLFFISLAACCAGILNTLNRFAASAFSPALLNIVLILSVFYGIHFMQSPVHALAWGVAIAGAVQFLFQWCFLKGVGLWVWPCWSWSHPGVQRVLKQMIPALFGASVGQLGLLIDTIFASYLKTGSISWLYYSDRLMQFPLALLGVALGTVALPYLAKAFAKGDTERYTAILNWALRLAVVFALPSAMGLALLAYPVLSALFQYGLFSVFDALQAQKSLVAYSFGLFGFILVKVLVSAFYARQDIKTPVKIATATLAVNIILNAALIVPLAHTGLAIATTLSSLFNALCLFAILYYRKCFCPQGAWLWLFLRVALALAAMSAVLWLWMPPAVLWSGWGMETRLIELVRLVMYGGLTYLGALLVLGMRWRDLRL